MLQFMKCFEEHQFLYNLIIMISSKSREIVEPLINQYDVKVDRFGQTRLRSLELMFNIFSLLHPSNGVLASAQLLLEGQ